MIGPPTDPVVRQAVRDISYAVGYMAITVSGVLTEQEYAITGEWPEGHPRPTPEQVKEATTALFGHLHGVVQRMADILDSVGAEHYAADLRSADAASMDVPDAG